MATEQLQLGDSTDTYAQVAGVIKKCRGIYEKKLKDYGTSWRVMRPSSITDQIFIKAHRIRTLESTPGMVNEGIEGEFMAIVNYGVIALIQLDLGSKFEELKPQEALRMYDKWAGHAIELMMAKNHDYGEAWRSMRVSSFTDIILQKLLRTKQIEDNCGNTLISEGVDANYLDMINYAIFALIKLA